MKATSGGGRRRSGPRPVAASVPRVRGAGPVPSASRGSASSRARARAGLAGGRPAVASRPGAGPGGASARAARRPRAGWPGRRARGSRPARGPAAATPSCDSGSSTRIRAFGRRRHRPVQVFQPGADAAAQVDHHDRAGRAGQRGLEVGRRPGLDHSGPARPRAGAGAAGPRSRSARGSPAPGSPTCDSLLSIWTATPARIPSPNSVIVTPWPRRGEGRPSRRPHRHRVARPQHVELGLNRPDEVRIRDRRRPTASARGRVPRSVADPTSPRGPPRPWPNAIITKCSAWPATPRPRRSRRPIATWPASITPTSTRATRRPRPSSRKRSRPTTSCPTPRSGRSTTASATPRSRGWPPPGPRAGGTGVGRAARRGPAVRAFDFSEFFGPGGGAAGRRRPRRRGGGIFEDLLGRMRGGRAGAPRRAAARAGTSRRSLTIPFLTAVRGGETTIELDRERPPRVARRQDPPGHRVGRQAPAPRPGRAGREGRGRAAT